MAQTRMLELVVGLFVLLGVAALFLLTLQVSTANDFTQDESYRVSARFQNIGSLRTRAPVTLAGVTIGRVVDIRIDSQTFEAVVEMRIAGEYDQLPADSDASIHTAGLLGEQYIAITPGGAPEPLQNGDEIRFTQSALVLENLIGRLVTSMGGD